MRSWVLLPVLMLGAFSVFGQSLPPGSRADTSIFSLNDKHVQIIRYQYGEPHIRFLALHDSEKTGLKAAFQFMGIYGGCAVELKYGNVRNIDFLDSLRQYSFDPNNMFTDQGAYLGLVRYSELLVYVHLPEKIRALGKEVLKFGKLDSLGVMVTLHNNYNNGFSVASYTKGNYLENSAEDVFVSPEMDPDDLVLVTDRRFFEYLKNRDINVVLQGLQAPDDGSLSVFAMQNSIPYANIEVQHGHLAENFRLIVVVSEMLKEIPTRYHSTEK